VSLVRYDDGTLLDAARVSAACHAQGTLLLWTSVQACGAVPMSVKDLGADFMVCAGYKWLLSCYGTGFFWIKTEHLDGLLPGPFYWTGQNTDHFSELNFVDPKPSRNAKTLGRRRMGNVLQLHLSAMAESVDFVLRAGPQRVAEHNRSLIEFMYRHLQRIVVLPPSPLESRRRGPLDASQRANRKGLSSFTRSCGEKTLS